MLALALFGIYMAVAQTPAEPKHRVVFQLSEAEGPAWQSLVTHVNKDIVAVYRELLKMYKPRHIGMFGASGGCTLAQTTILWLPEKKLPLPGAVGLGTCSGGSNPGDAR